MVLEPQLPNLSAYGLALSQCVSVQGLEKYLMTKIYYKTFAQSGLDRERDMALSQRMTALTFVQPHHLDIPKNYQEDNAIQLAIKELHKINNYKVCFGLT